MDRFLLKANELSMMAVSAWAVTVLEFQSRHEEQTTLARREKYDATGNRALVDNRGVRVDVSLAGLY